MRSMFPKNLSTSGKLFTNERTSVSFKGILVLNQGKPRIDFENNIDVKSTDWLVNSVGEKLYVTESVSLSNAYKSCYYISEHKYNQSKQSNPVFSINATTIENSIIGTQTNATINLNAELQKLKSDIDSSNSPDKEELYQIISLLEELKNSQEPIPKGFLSKFSAIICGWLSAKSISTSVAILSAEIVKVSSVFPLAELAIL